MKTFIEDLAQQKIDKLKEWRSRYPRNEYPLKVAQNLLYEALTIQALWPEMKQIFEPAGHGKQRPRFSEFDQAHGYIYDRRRQVQVDQIRPMVLTAYEGTTTIPRLNFTLFKQRVKEAQRGNVKMIEEVDFTYYFHTSAYEMIYAWLAAGTMGYDESKAYEHVTPVAFTGIDYQSLDSLIGAFGQNSSLYYKPL
jgi:hypothetical protein